MAITLGGVTINDNMYLDGIEKAQLTQVEQLRTVDGNSIVRVKATPGGRTLTLGTQNRGGATQGIWFSQVIDQVKSLEALAQPVVLDYRGDTYNVLIVETDFVPFLQYEPEGSCKKFTGSITLLEV
jgi:hypothetical protein